MSSVFRGIRIKGSENTNAPESKTFTGYTLQGAMPSGCSKTKCILSGYVILAHLKLACHPRERVSRFLMVRNRRAVLMATITPIKVAPHTRIDNSIIDDYLPQIGCYGYTIYSVIKRHLNQKSGQCNPSYNTIARKIGIDRGTVIRYVKKLKALHLISPLLRFKEDGSPTSNQYNFQGTEKPVPSKETDKSDQAVQGSGPESSPLVVEGNQGSGTEPPKQSSSNKKQRSITEVNLFPTEKQKACPHPPSEIVFMADHITLCHHCYGLLDEHLQLIVDGDKSPEDPHAEGEEASQAA